jgi:hypothetical protein
VGTGVGVFTGVVVITAVTVTSGNISELSTTGVAVGVITSVGVMVVVTVISLVGVIVVVTVIVMVGVIVGVGVSGTSHESVVWQLLHFPRG